MHPALEAYAEAPVRRWRYVAAGAVAGLAALLVAATLIGGVS